MKTIITIDGIDGSGKSTFARRLQTDLGARGHRALIVSIDDFRRPVAWNALAEPELEVYYHRYYDLALAEQCLRAFLACETAVTIPRYDSVTESIQGARELVFDGNDVAIVEGVFPLRVPAVGTGLVVRLEVTRDEARRRIITRDMKKKRTREEAERRINRRYFPSQDRYLAECSPATRADVVIENEQPATQRVIKRDLSRLSEPLRSAIDSVIPR